MGFGDYEVDQLRSLLGGRSILRAGRDIASYCRPQTRVIWIEAPGSLTYEIPEIDEVIACAKTRGIITIADNTWSSSCLFKPLDHGIDVSIVSATKYLSGHSDASAAFLNRQSFGTNEQGRHLAAEPPTPEPPLFS